jgi:hypothetical protein
LFHKDWELFSIFQEVNGANDQIDEEDQADQGQQNTDRSALHKIHETQHKNPRTDKQCDYAPGKRIPGDQLYYWLLIRHVYKM